MLSTYHHRGGGEDTPLSLRRAYSPLAAVLSRQEVWGKPVEDWLLKEKIIPADKVYRSGKTAFWLWHPWNRSLLVGCCGSIV
jgi:hypothetical protein